VPDDVWRDPRRQPNLPTLVGDMQRRLESLEQQLANTRRNAGSNAMPPGTISPFAGPTAPPGWLICDGTAVSRTTYAALYAVVGLTYGVGDGSSTFALPNLKGRVPVGRDAAQAEFDTLGETGGVKAVALGVAEMPVHSHVQDAHNHGQNAHAHGPTGGSNFAVYGSQNQVGWGPNPKDMGFSTATATATATNIAATATNQNAGGGGAHNNLQPYLALNYMIKT
jgi:microcystin-dependent protein